MNVIPFNIAVDVGEQYSVQHLIRLRIETGLSCPLELVMAIPLSESASEVLADDTRAVHVVRLSGMRLSHQPDVFMLKIASRWQSVNRWKSMTTTAASSEDSGSTIQNASL